MKLPISRRHGLILSLVFALAVAITVPASAQTNPAPPTDITYTYSAEMLKAAQSGNAEAQYQLGMCYAYGWGIAKNETQKNTWMLRAANNNYVKAQKFMATCYKLQKNMVKFEEMMTRAANLGDAEAQDLLGCYYLFERKHPGYIEKGVQWLKKAAAQGYAYAICDLGHCYANGNGVPEDPKKAFECYMTAEKQNITNAQLALAYCYYYGEGVEEDKAAGIQWLKKFIQNESSKPNANQDILASTRNQLSEWENGEGSGHQEIREEDIAIGSIEYEGDEDGIDMSSLKENTKAGGTMVVPKEEEVVDNAIVEVQATYPGGEAQLLKDVKDNLVYPAAAKAQGLEGVVIVRFRVEKNGAIGEAKIVKSLSKECNEAAIATIKKLKHFKPATQQGRPVPVWFTCPVRFRIPQ